MIIEIQNNKRNINILKTCYINFYTLSSILVLGFSIFSMQSGLASLVNLRV